MILKAMKNPFHQIFRVHACILISSAETWLALTVWSSNILNIRVWHSFLSFVCWFELTQVINQTMKYYNFWTYKCCRCKSEIFQLQKIFDNDPFDFNWISRKVFSGSSINSIWNHNCWTIHLFQLMHRLLYTSNHESMSATLKQNFWSLQILHWMCTMYMNVSRNCTS